MAATVACPNCGANVPHEHRFCGQCGHPMKSVQAARVAPAAPQPAAVVGAGRARLVLIRGEGMDGVSYQLNAAEHIAGRKSGAILFPEDHYLSPRHANFFYDGGQLHVRDEGSLNGVYLRIREPRRLGEGEVFLAGEELLRVSWKALDGQVAGPDGTHFFASPAPATTRRVTQLFEGGRPGLCHLVRTASVTVGRENCDIEFPHDRFISGRHCQVDFDAHGAVVTDLGSRNGTYVRIKGQQGLSHGDYLFVGKQLLRVELSGQERTA